MIISQIISFPVTQCKCNSVNVTSIFEEFIQKGPTNGVNPLDSCILLSTPAVEKKCLRFVSSQYFLSGLLDQILNTIFCNCFCLLNTLFNISLKGYPCCHQLQSWSSRIPNLGDSRCTWKYGTS